MLPRYKYLLTYRYSEIIHDLTVKFCGIYLPGREYQRTREQMVQAARSIKQNIVEGVEGGKTSKKTEIKLLGVARASGEELIADYEDYLRQRGMERWTKSDPRIEKIRERAYYLSSLSNLSDLGDLKEKPRLPDDPETAANCLLTLCHICGFVLSRQVVKAESDFLSKGGFTESLYRRRIAERKK